MTEIILSKTLAEVIDKLINDDFVKREFGYRSVTDFVIQAVEGLIEADKDTVGIPID